MNSKETSVSSNSSPSRPPSGRGRVAIVASLAESLVNFRGELIQRIIRNGYEVHAIAPEIPPRVAAQLADWGCTVHPISMARAALSPWQDARTFLQLAVLLRRIRPAALLTYTIKPVVYGTWAGYLSRVPLRAAMVTGLGFSAGTHWGPRVARLLYRSALSRASRVFFQNSDDAELLGFSAKNMTLINGSGVDLSQFMPETFPAHPPVRFLLIARLLKAKGIYEYVAAARQIREASPLSEFHLVGWIDANPDAIEKRDLEEWTKEGLIIYHGRIDDVRPIIAHCHVYVLPSYREGTPRSVLEAEAMGRPIITTSAPGCKETVVDGHNGYLVPPRDSSALAGAMMSFIRAPERIAEFGARSRALAVEKYDVHDINARVLSAMGLSA